MMSRLFATTGSLACLVAGALPPARAQTPTRIDFEDLRVRTPVDTQYLRRGLRVTTPAVIDTLPHPHSGRQLLVATSPNATAALALFGRCSSHEPRVELLVNGEKVATVTFGVDLELHLESATLTIQDGKILEAKTGTCVGKGTLKCEGAVLVERSSAEIPLPGRLTFGEGIPIRPGR